MSGQRLIVLTLDFFLVLASKIIQVLDSKPGSFNHTCISFHFSKMLFAMGDDLSYGLNTLGPLCLWQCFKKKNGVKMVIYR